MLLLILYNDRLFFGLFYQTRKDHHICGGVFRMTNMQILVLVLNKYERLGKLLVSLNDAGIKGATVINTTGMAQLLCRETDAMLGSLRAFLTPEREDNRTVFMVLSDEKVEIAKKIIHDVVGTLEKPGSGILFTAPTLSVEGLGSFVFKISIKII